MRRLQPGFVGGRRRVVSQLVVGITQLNFMRAYAADLAQKVAHARQALVAVYPLHARQKLPGHDIGRNHLFAHAAARVLQLQPNQRREKHHHHGGDDEVDLQASASRPRPCRAGHSARGKLTGAGKAIQGTHEGVQHLWRVGVVTAFGHPHQRAVRGAALQLQGG